MVSISRPGSITNRPPGQRDLDGAASSRGAWDSSTGGEILIPRKQVAYVLAFFVVFFGLVDLLTQTLDRLLSPAFPIWIQVVKAFDLDREFALPTWYSIILLFIISVTLALLTWQARRASDPHWKRWLVLSAIFLAFSIDEQVLGHESAGDILGEKLDTGGLFYYAWVIPGIVGVLLAGIAFIPLLRAQTRSVRNGMLLAAMCYVGGALGIEMISGIVAESRGLDSLSYAMATSVEEILELCGLSIFLLVLLDLAQQLAPDVTLRLR